MNFSSLRTNRFSRVAPAMVSAWGLAMAAVVVVLWLVVGVGVARADFGIEPGSFKVTALNEDGSSDIAASSHPYAFIVRFAMKMNAEGRDEGGALRNLLINLPPGFAGDPQAMPQCPRALFDEGKPECPTNTIVGVVHLEEPGLGLLTLPVFNVVPPPGVPAELAVGNLSFNSLEPATVLSEDGYRLQSQILNLPLEFTAIEGTIWGTPADPGHDAERGEDALEQSVPPVPFTGGPSQAFLTMPAGCQAPPEVTIKVSSVLAPNVYDEESEPFREADGNPIVPSGCEAVPFDPSIVSQPTSRVADSPSGLGF